MSTLQQNLQRPFYIKHLLERLRYGKAAVAMRREAAELIEKMNEDSSNLSAQNSYQAMRIEELERDLAARDAELAEWKRKAEENARDAERYKAALNHERTALSIVRDRQCHEGICTVSLADISKGIALLDAAIAAKGEA